MKHLYFLCLIIFLASCAETNYYQVFRAIPENGTLKNNSIIFEDKNCTVSYNLWSEGGDIGFSIYNKTDADLTIDLTKTFFVMNGVANEYFRNRTVSMSSSSGTTLTSYIYPAYYWNPAKISGTNSSSFSTSYIEKPELTIPPKTSINISEYRISNARIINCNLESYPSIGDKIYFLKYDKSISPFVFYNLITYKTKGDTRRLENRFFISEITNIPSTYMFTEIDTSDCGEKLRFPKEVFKNSTPDKFYLHYKE